MSIRQQPDHQPLQKIHLAHHDLANFREKRPYKRAGALHLFINRTNASLHTAYITLDGQKNQKSVRTKAPRVGPILEIRVHPWFDPAHAKTSDPKGTFWTGRCDIRLW